MFNRLYSYLVIIDMNMRIILIKYIDIKIFGFSSHKIFNYLFVSRVNNS